MKSLIEKVTITPRSKKERQLLKLLHLLNHGIIHARLYGYNLDRAQDCERKARAIRRYEKAQILLNKLQLNYHHRDK